MNIIKSVTVKPVVYLYSVNTEGNNNITTWYIQSRRSEKECNNNYKPHNNSQCHSHKSLLQTQDNQLTLAAMKSMNMITK